MAWKLKQLSDGKFSNDNAVVEEEYLEDEVRSNICSIARHVLLLYTLCWNVCFEAYDQVEIVQTKFAI